MRLLIISTVVAGITLSGCTTNPTTGQSQLNKTAIGAGAGVLLGVIAGAATSKGKDRNERMLKGAAIGGALGGGVGLYMDRQEKQLREQMQQLVLLTSLCQARLHFQQVVRISIHLLQEH